MASYDDDKQKLLNRLKRIEGQTRGIQRMGQEDKYCGDEKISEVLTVLKRYAKAN